MIGRIKVWLLGLLFVYYSIIKNISVMREELEALLAKLEDVELDLVERDIIQDGDRLSDALGVIKGKIMDEWNK
jgi:hypothetical protein